MSDLYRDVVVFVVYAWLIIMIFQKVKPNRKRLQNELNKKGTLYTKKTN